MAHLSQLFIDSVLAAKWAAMADKKAAEEAPDAKLTSESEDVESGAKRGAAEGPVVVEMEARAVASGQSPAGVLGIGGVSAHSSGLGSRLDREGSTEALRTMPTSDSSPLESEDVERGESQARSRNMGGTHGGVRDINDGTRGRPPGPPHDTAAADGGGVAREAEHEHDEEPPADLLQV